MKKSILKYGVFAILFCMLGGILYMLDHFQLRSQTSVQVFVLGSETCRAYVAPDAGFSPIAGDTIVVNTTLGGEIAFVVDTVCGEPSSMVLGLHTVGGVQDLKHKLGGNGYTPGYISTGKVKLRTLVFRRVKVL